MCGQGQCGICAGREDDVTSHRLSSYANHLCSAGFSKGKVAAFDYTSVSLFFFFSGPFAALESIPWAVISLSVVG